MEQIITSFPGQGAQYPGMALDFYEQSSEVKHLFDVASTTCGLDIKKILEEGDAEVLKETKVAQVSITLANMASLTVLKERGFTPLAVTGFSLGEFAALCAAEVFSVETLFQLVSSRGHFMDEACKKATADHGALTMAAVIGLPREKVESILHENNVVGLYMANDNSEKQVVLSGVTAEVDRLTPLLKEKGARRIIKLAVAGPFHSPFMKQAEEAFRKEIETVSFNNPTIPVYGNVNGQALTKGDEIKRLSPLQITHPVAWRDTMRNILHDYSSDHLFVESGPGKVLTGFWKSVGVKCQPCGSIELIEKLMERK
jgi:[acyl-carrier-protein] S-malonyltransferase